MEKVFLLNVEAWCKMRHTDPLVTGRDMKVWYQVGLVAGEEGPVPGIIACF